MTHDLIALYLSAIALGFVHTVLGPDHYLPFVAMARAREWSGKKTVLVTICCGVGHVLSSVLLALAGVLLGISVLKLESIESIRGDLAGWLLLMFGLTYFTWGTFRAIRNKPHSHVHVHADRTVHRHRHDHSGKHLHAHEHRAASRRSLTPWVLFVIFLFGPCEALIPLAMYPAANGQMLHMVLICAAFAAVTVLTMTVIVIGLYLGAGRLPATPLQRYGHALAGLIILACGASVIMGL